MTEEQIVEERGGVDIVLEKNFVWLTWITSIISAITTILGLLGYLNPGKPWYARELVAVTVGLAAMLIPPVFWGAMYKKFPLAPRRMKNLYFLVITALGLVIFFMSTVFSVMGIGGDEALQRHMYVTIEEAEIRLDSLYKQAVAQRQIAPLLENLAKQFNELAKGESAGKYTGTQGYGTVAATFDQLAVTCSNLKKTLDASSALGDENHKKINVKITALRSVVFQDSANTHARNSVFAGYLNELNGLFTVMAGASVLPAVKEMSANLDKLTLKTVDNSDLGNRQGQTLKNASEGVVGAAKASLVKAISEIEPRDKSNDRPFAVESMSTAIFKYAGHIAAAWASALALDFWPLVGLFVLSLVAMSQNGEEDLGQITIAEIQRAQRAAKLIEE